MTCVLYIECTSGIVSVLCTFERELIHIATVPPALKLLLHDPLKCRICHNSPLEPSITFAKAANQSSAVSSVWMSGLQMVDGQRTALAALVIGVSGRP